MSSTFYKKGLFFIKDGELHNTEHCQGFAKREGARSLGALVLLHNTKNDLKKRGGGKLAHNTAT